MTSPIALLPRRPLLELPFLLPSACNTTPLLLRRNESSYRRIKQRLRVKPDPSFNPSTTEAHDHIIYNPPSSAPSVYQTPAKFLPPNDVRRQLQVSSPADESRDVDRLPVLFKNVLQEKRYLTEEQIAEMRRLRKEDPMTWSRNKLAKKFNCNPVFVAAVCEASPEKKALQRRVLEAVKSRWGKKRAIAREDRELRKEVWAKDL
ncbi:hypothetical protein VTO42DRAFT_4332 [Malbranchea cinnamomea]